MRKNFFGSGLVMARMKFMNIEIDNLTMDEALENIEVLIQQNRNSYVVTPNVDHIVMLEKDKEFATAYKNADLILTDGKPLIWISRYYKLFIKEKISGSDLFPRICEMAARKQYKMFFLGAAEGVAAKAANNLIMRYPGLQVVGTYSPPYGFEKQEQEIYKIIDMVKSAAPDILIVGFGAPKQEKFIYNNRIKLGVPVSLGLGASFDFEAGNLKRAPKWMSDLGLEWMYRIIQEPKRMSKRYFMDAVRIVPLIHKYKNNT